VVQSRTERGPHFVPEGAPDIEVGFGSGAELRVLSAVGPKPALDMRPEPRRNIALGDACGWIAKRPLLLAII